MNERLLRGALHVKPEQILIVTHKTDHVFSNAETMQEIFYSTEKEEQLLSLADEVRTIGVGLESYGDNPLLKEDYANLGFTDAIVKKFKAVNKFINSVTDFSAWSNDEVKEVKTLLAQAKGDTDGKEIHMPAGARFLQLYPTKDEDVVKVLKELREYIAKILPSDDIYSAIDKYIETVTDQTLAIAENFDKVEDKTDSGTLKTQLLDMYKGIYFDVVEDVKKAYDATKEVDDKRYGKEMITFVSPVLPANMVISVPMLRKDAAFKYIPIKTELTSFVKNKRLIDMRSIKTLGEFKETIIPLKKDEVVEVLKEVEQLSVVLSQAKEISKNHMAVEKAIEKALTKTEAVLTEKGSSLIAKTQAKFVIKMYRNDCLFMLKGVSDLSNLSVEVIESALKLCRKSIAAYS